MTFAPSNRGTASRERTRVASTTSPAPASRGAGAALGGRSRVGGAGAAAPSAAASTTASAAAQEGSTDGPQIRYRCTFKNTIGDAMRIRKGWTETDVDSPSEWDVAWVDVHRCREILDNFWLADHQRINHFRNHYELTRKDLLVKNVKRYRRELAKESAEAAAAYDIIPTSFLLPADYALFVDEFKKRPGLVWIMKPIGRSQGKGIFLFTKLSDISDWRKDYSWKADTADKTGQAEAYIVQRYIENPYLIGGRKFDMRIYVMVTAYNPLKVWLNRYAFARFSGSRFSMKPEDVENTYIHLTNVAVQKTAPDYDAEKGAKWEMRALKTFLKSRHGEARVLQAFDDLQTIIMKALFCVRDIMIQDKHCFELYGYDILFDAELRPWVLEVNASPSMSTENKYDYDRKLEVLSDLWNIVDPEKRLSGTETQVGGFDLIWNDGPVTSAVRGAHGTLLGAHNDREENLRKLHNPAFGGDIEPQT